MFAPKFELIDNNIAVMRNRVRVKSIEEAFPDYKDDNKKGDEKKSGKYHGKRSRCSLTGGKLFLILVIFSVIAAFRSGVERNRGHSTTPHASTVAVDNTASTSAELQERALDSTDTGSEPEDYSRCINNPPQPALPHTVDSAVEPFWLPAYPSSFPMLGYSSFVEELTGVLKAAKSYYRQSPMLKRCHTRGSAAKVQAVTCEIVHPIVPCQRPHPSHQAANFAKKVLLTTRDPMTAFPAVHQSKAEAYHGQVGQVEKEKWIQFRDQYVGSSEDSHMMSEWKKFIMEWRGMNPYHIALYMPWEYWLDKKQGPALTKRLATLIKDEGFPVLFNVDDDATFECLWYRHIYEGIMAEEKKKIDDGWYEPEYTPEQLEMIASEVEKFAAEIEEMMNDEDKKRPGDGHLHQILVGYAKHARDVISEKS
mmetsp:Transcript_28316/g.59816  ORF Transcript_28316/g.59816 Transcript_28316/m.59816 type:complete len:422 (-) Transcript_28316:53-1318(-)